MKNIIKKRFTPVFIWLNWWEFVLIFFFIFFELHSIFRCLLQSVVLLVEYLLDLHSSARALASCTPEKRWAANALLKVAALHSTPSPPTELNMCVCVCVKVFLTTFLSFCCCCWMHFISSFVVKHARALALNARLQ